MSRHGAAARSHVAVLLLSAVVLGLAEWLRRIDGSPFRRYFGSLHPLLVISSVVLLGVLSLGWLSGRGWFEIHRPGTKARGPAVATAWGTVLGAVIVVGDLGIRFPPDINVPWPRSLLFYPVMAFVAEVVFHTVPLALLLAFLASVRTEVDRQRTLRTAILVVCLLEPVYQVGLSAADAIPPWALAYVGLHLLAFNLIGLWLFRRYGFLSMYGFRLVYYLHWHIVWGAVRLKVMF